MPELPEVETYRRYFEKHALHQRIARVDVRDERILGEIRTETFVRRLRGRSFSEARRHGKHLFANAGTAWLHLHFGMTGDLEEAIAAGSTLVRIGTGVFGARG